MPKKQMDKIKPPPQLLRGMKDILPEEQRYWDFVRRRVDVAAQAYGFGRIDTPILEESSLFVRTVGQDTDIIEKEMYTFADKGGDSISLRPENTAGVVRAYLEHGMFNRPQPVKLYYVGPFFRYDRPQAGRYRQFYQFGFEILGDDHPVMDAQLMMLAYNFYHEMDLSVSLQVNSIGCPICREQYKKALLDYYRPRRNALCEDCKRRLQRNPLRLLDCKEKDCQTLSLDAPQTVDYLCEDCNRHFVKVLEQLDQVEIPYVLNARLVRGLDYYSRTTFEIWPTVRESVPGLVPDVNVTAGETEKPETEKPGAQSALGGGGRYDYLAKSLGGKPTPALGFAGGIERLIIELKGNDRLVDKVISPDIFVAQLGDSARKKALVLFEELRRAGLKVSESFSKDGLKSQMELANKFSVKYAVIIGQKEILDETVLIRDMENGIQETVDYRKIVPELKKRLERNSVVAANHKTEHHHIGESL